MKTSQLLSSMLTGTNELRAAVQKKAIKPVKKVEKSTAKFLDNFLAQAECDVTLLQGGNLEYRMDDLLRRRKNSALSGQHRITQRLDKHIALLRGALGLPPMPPEEIVRTHTTSKDPLNNTDLEIASDSSYDTEWVRKITSRGLFRLRESLAARGYSYTCTPEGYIKTHVWTGKTKSGQVDKFELSTLNRWWCMSAVHNGTRIDAFDFAKSNDNIARGLPQILTASTWNGKFDVETAKKYSVSWVSVFKEMDI